jgi:hypothetical protein
MRWCINFFRHKADIWTGLMDKAALAEMTGHKCYAARQAHIYHQLAGHAEESFGKLTLHQPSQTPVP